MFVTENQFYVFIACVATGGVCGLFFTGASVFKPLKKPWLTACADVTAFFLSFCVFALVSYLLRFPSFRPYMAVGVFAGIYAYCKSFGFILAKFTEKLYNILIVKFRKEKNQRCLKKSERLKRKPQRKTRRKRNQNSKG